jgi:hypothetical protein
MVRIRNLKELRAMPDGVARRAMEANAALCHDGDDELLEQMEEEFNGPLGADWFVFEEGDDPRNFFFDEGYPVDLLSDEWRWCDAAVLENGCFVIFWACNDAGGPCLFLADEPWIYGDLRSRLEDLVAECA